MAMAILSSRGELWMKAMETAIERELGMMMMIVTMTKLMMNECNIQRIAEEGYGVHVVVVFNDKGWYL